MKKSRKKKNRIKLLSNDIVRVYVRTTNKQLTTEEKADLYVDIDRPVFDQLLKYKVRITYNNDGFGHSRFMVRGIKLHHFVAAFYGLPFDGHHTMIDHRDNNYKNNTVENLQWTDNIHNASKDRLSTAEMPVLAVLVTRKGKKRMKVTIGRFVCDQTRRQIQAECHNVLRMPITHDDKVDLLKQIRQKNKHLTYGYSRKPKVEQLVLL